MPGSQGVNREDIDSYDKLWAVLHVDRGVIGLLELPSIDGTVQENGRTVAVAFGTQAPPQPAPVPAAQAAPVAQAVSAAAPGAPVTQPQVLPPAGARPPLMGWPALAALGAVMVIAGTGIYLSRARIQKS